MYKGKKILGFIPARGGSKGIPHKNIVDLCGKPLISYTINAGLKSKYIDYLMVSTDDEMIAKVSRENGADIPFMRPAILASDTSKTIDAVVHAIDMLKRNGREFDTLVLLQPTQPLRTEQDIDKSIEIYYDNGCQPLISVCEVDESPVLMRSIANNRLYPLLNGIGDCRRQDMPHYYIINGCIYINEIDTINESTNFGDNIIPYIMEKSHSVDIDEISDLKLAENYLKNK